MAEKQSINMTDSHNPSVPEVQAGSQTKSGPMGANLQTLATQKRG